MPWFPEFVSAVELARLQTRAARQADPVGQCVDALNKGDTHLLETVWPGEVVVYDPRSGEVRGHWRLRQFVRQSQSWLAERHARVETVACTVAGDTIQPFPSFSGIYDTALMARCMAIADIPSPARPLDAQMPNVPR